MKKTLAVLLAVMMIFSCCALSFGVFAEETTAEEAVVCDCTCLNCITVTKDEIGPTDTCRCCLKCAYLDKRCLTKCVAVDENGNIDFDQPLCCDECTGVWPCMCGHDCCDPNEGPDEDYVEEPIFNQSQQNTIVMVLQNIIMRFSDAFDKIFNTIFEFLRISEVFPDIKI